MATAPTTTLIRNARDESHGELQQVVDLTQAHINKIYITGYLYKMTDKNADGVTLLDAKWRKVFARLGGSTLSIWDAKAMKRAKKSGSSEPPTYINIANSQVQVLESIVDADLGYLSTSRPGQIVSINTKGRNRILFSCPGPESPLSWAAAFRLAAWEKSRIEEIYTGHLLRLWIPEGLESEMGEPAAPSPQPPGRLEGWAKVRVGSRTQWERLWVVISYSSMSVFPPESSGSSSRTLSRLAGFMGGRSRSMSSSDYSDSSSIGSPVIALYPSDRAKDRRRLRYKTVSVAQAFALYPNELEAAHKSSIFKVEATFNDEQPAISPSGAREDYALFVVEAKGGVQAADEMLKWLFAIHDAFGLYGRPEEYTWDPHNPQSMFFAYPQGPHRGKLFLDLDLAAGLDERIYNSLRVREALRDILTLGICESPSDMGQAQDQMFHTGDSLVYGDPPPDEEQHDVGAAAASAAAVATWASLLRAIEPGPERDKGDDDSGEEHDHQRERGEEKWGRREREEVLLDAEEETEVARQREKEEAREKRSKYKRKLRSVKSDEGEDDEEDDADLAEEARKIALRRQIERDNRRKGRLISNSPPRWNPPTGRTRIWHDRSGQHSVEAEFMGFENGKIRLHKLNGATIEVPPRKMWPEDLKYIAKVTGASINDDGGEPLVKAGERYILPPVPLGELKELPPLPLFVDTTQPDAGSTSSRYSVQQTAYPAPIAKDTTSTVLWDAEILPIEENRIITDQDHVASRNRSEDRFPTLEHLMAEYKPLDLTDQVDIPDYRNPAQGGLADVYAGLWNDRRVAVKVLRFRRSLQTDSYWESSHTRRIEREINVWAALKHRNICEFLGYSTSFSDYPAMISTWCQRGTASEHLKRQSLSIMERMGLDVIDGIHYLHELKIIHGDLKPSNILVDDDCVAQLCDFGLVRLSEWEGPAGMTTTTPYTGTERYKAPELFETAENRHPVATLEGDIFSLGCVMLQFIEQIDPFRRFSTPRDVKNAVMDGESPALRLETTHALLQSTEFFWNLLEACWGDESDRPSIGTVVDAMNYFALRIPDTQ